MKRMKKIASMLLAVIMVLGMSLTAFATENDPVTTQNGKGNFAITLKGVAQDNHIFEAYQIFQGDLSQENQGTDGTFGTETLSNIQWGSSINTDKLGELLTELKGITLEDGTKPFEEIVPSDSETEKQTTAAKVAEMLGGRGHDTEIAIAFADVVGSTDDNDALKYLGTAAKTTEGTKGTAEKVGDKTTYTYTIAGLTAGYYLVQEKGVELGADDAFTRNMLEVVSNVTANVKTEIPTIEKKIVTGPNPDDRADANNAGVGKVVSYEVTGKVPNTTGYDYYFYVINDTLSKGLTFNKDVTVKVGEKVCSVYSMPVGFAVTGTPTEEEQAIIDKAKEADVVVYQENVTSPDSEAGKTKVKIAFNDIMSSSFTAGDDIVVNYSATVNSDAVIGTTGNPNEVSLTYSNNPNHDYEGDKNDNTPGVPDSTQKELFGETEKDITITYVAEIDIVKSFSDISTGALPGATFTLTGTSTQTILTNGTYYEEKAGGNYYLLTDGTYTTTPPTTQSYMEESTSSTAGYVVAEENYDEHDTVIAKVSESSDETAVYRPYKAGDTGTVYRLVVENTDSYVSTTVTYEKKENVTTTETVTTYVNMVGTTNEKGELVFKGLGAGTYTLEETGVPAGYNKAENVTIVIECDVPEVVTGGDEKAEWKIGATTTDGVALVFPEGEDGKTSSIIGVYQASIMNSKGSLLPSTGGIGTTIFYVVGGILVIGAGILLVAKKRMGNR